MTGSQPFTAGRSRKAAGAPSRAVARKTGKGRCKRDETLLAAPPDAETAQLAAQTAGCADSYGGAGERTIPVDGQPSTILRFPEDAETLSSYCFS